MTFLERRLQKAEEAHQALAGGDTGPVFFFRDNPGVPRERENRFRKENPDFKGEIHIYRFGTANLTPSSREIC